MSSPAPTPPDEARCMACGTPRSESPPRRFVDGTRGTLCSACVAQAHKWFGIARRGEVLRFADVDPKADHRFGCSFCGLDAKFTGALAVWERGSICKACVEMMMEMLWDAPAPHVPAPAPPRR